MILKDLKWAFFGIGNFSVLVLDELKSNLILPNLIVTTPGKPQGRGLKIKDTPTKTWATQNNIPFVELESLKNSDKLSGFDLFVVASYGLIIPKNILGLPKYKTLNIHPSLLPKLRGPSPIVSAILEENETGVTIIELDEKIDHGPILVQEKLSIDWPPYAEDLEKELAKVGAQLLIKSIENIENKIAQDESKVTWSKKISKSDAEINLNDNPEKNLRKIRAYHVWPGAFFFQDNKRIIVKRARIENDSLVIERIIPEGKKEMDYSDFIRNRN